MCATHVDCGDVHPVPFDNVHQVVRRSVRLSDRDIGVRYPVLAEDSLDFIVVYIRKWHGVRDGYTTLVLLPNDDRWRFLVQPDPETFELGFDYFLVAEGFEHVQDDKD